MCIRVCVCMCVCTHCMHMCVVHVYVEEGSDLLPNTHLTLVF